jgi:transcriptional regulator with XRE-family HTH domain
MKETMMVDLDLVARFVWRPENGAKLRAVREQKQFSRPVLASSLAARLKDSPTAEGLSTKYIERLEAGVLKTVSAESLSAIASLLGVGCEDLLLQNHSVKIIYRDSVDM